MQWHERAGTTTRQASSFAVRHDMKDKIAMRISLVKIQPAARSVFAVEVLVWIVLSVVASLLTSYSSATGSEGAGSVSAQATPTTLERDDATSTRGTATPMWEAIQSHQTQWGIAVSGLNPLSRLERDSNMRGAWESIILAESNRLVRRSFSKAQATVTPVPVSQADDPEVRLAAAKLHSAYSLADLDPKALQREQLGSIFASLTKSTDENLTRRFHQQIQRDWMIREARGMPLPGLARLVSFQAETLFEPVVVRDLGEMSIADSTRVIESEIGFEKGPPNVMSVDDAIVIDARPMLSTDEDAQNAVPTDVQPFERDVRLETRTAQTGQDQVSVDPVEIAAIPARLFTAQKSPTDMPRVRELGQRREQPKRMADNLVLPVGLPLVPANTDVDPDQAIAATDEITNAVTGDGSLITQQAPVRIAQREANSGTVPSPLNSGKKPSPKGNRVLNMNVTDTSVHKIFELLARNYGMNILVSPDVDGTFSANISKVSPEEMLEAVLRLNNLRAIREGEMIYVHTPDTVPAQARELYTFPLGPGQASMLEATVQGLLSPIGNAYVTSLGQDKNGHNMDAMVVVDVPDNLSKIKEFIHEHDRMHFPIESRVLRMFPLDFARGEVLDPMVKGLLSPTGNSYVTALDAEDNLKTREAIVVVDDPTRIAEIESFILQADRPPRQVMVEARVLEVELGDDLSHGVDLTGLLRGELTVGSRGMTVPGLSTSIFAPRDPTFFASIGGQRINALVDLLEQTVDAKTLATPSVTVINGQKANLLVGNELGYPVTTVTLNATTQTIEFLKVGVSLQIEPTISRDNKILLRVRPEVSTGEIDFTTQTPVPSKGTRQVETSVLLNNHEGMVIGGLIEEKDNTEIRKLPWLGDLKYVGKLFQNRQVERSRTEIIVTLVPHIVEDGCNTIPDCIDCNEEALRYERTVTPLLHGALQRNCRPYEARLPDSTGAVRHLDVDEVNRMLP